MYQMGVSFYEDPLRSYGGIHAQGSLGKRVGLSFTPAIHTSLRWRVALLAVSVTGHTANVISEYRPNPAIYLTLPCLALPSSTHPAFPYQSWLLTCE